MEHRSVRGRAAGEMMALHDALKAFAAAGADEPHRYMLSGVCLMISSAEKLIPQAGNSVAA